MARKGKAKKKTGKNKDKYMRTIVLPHHANQGKVNKIVAVLPEYQKTTKAMQTWQYRRLLNGDGLYNRASAKDIESGLSARYQRSNLNQVVAGLKSWTALTQEKFTTIVHKSNLPDEVKHDLHRVNFRQNWYAKTLEVQVPVIQVDEAGKSYTEYVPYEISQEVLRLARGIVKQIKKHYNRLPNLAKSTTMLLDGPVSQFEVSQNSTFSYWSRISTLDKGSPVWIPLRDHHFARETTGKWCALTQVTVLRAAKKGQKNQIIIKQVKKNDLATERKVSIDGTEQSELEAAYEELLGSSLGPEDYLDIDQESAIKNSKFFKQAASVPVVAIDRGLVVLFATSEGDMLGRSLYPWLKEIDKELTQLTKHLQRQNIKLTNNARYVNMQRRITEYIENEIKRCLNVLVALHNPSEIVVELLDFRSSELSKQLNRILSRCGMSAMKDKLQSLHETLGITITYVPAAHSSQECSGCGFVNKTNRKSQSRFVCGFCGKKINADTNASYTNRSRRSWPVAMQYASRSKVLSYLDYTFTLRWGTSPSLIRDRVSAARKSTQSKKTRPTTDGLSDQLNVPSGQLGFESRELVSIQQSNKRI